MADMAPAIVTFRASDGYRFYARQWAANGRPRARIVWVHGVRSHGGWYGRSCAAMAAAGFDVSILDRRGAGLNTAHRGDTPGFRRLLDDVAEYIRDHRANRPWLPTFVGGVSWGGKLAVGLPHRRPGLVDGVILACPGLVPLISPPIRDRARITAARVLRPGRKFTIPLNEPELFTADPDWRTFVRDDRFGLREATARFMLASFGLDLYVRRSGPSMIHPVLLLLAERDRIISNSGTRTFIESFATTDRTVIEYPGAEHTLEFEGDGHPFVRDMAAWLNARL